MKGMVAPRGGMFVPPELTEQLIKGTKKKNSVGVMFSFEMLPTLHAKGFKDVTLIVQERPKKYIRNLCTKYGYAVKTLEEIEDMNFDVTIGNPPYQNVDKKNKNAKLWYDFGVRCANLNSEVIALVTPEAAFKDIDSNGKKLRKHLKELGYGIITVERHERGDYFDVGVDTCHWILSKKSDKDIDSAIFSYTDQKIVDICEKVVSYPKKLAMVTENDVANAELSESGRYEFYRSGLNKSCTDKTLSNIGKKIIFPFSASYKSLFFSKEPSGSLNKVVAVKSKNEAEQVIAYCLSDLFIFVANNYRKTSGFCPFVKKGLIPDLRGVDTQDLYALFGLTKDEIALVEAK